MSWKRSSPSCFFLLRHQRFGEALTHMWWTRGQWRRMGGDMLWNGNFDCNSALIIQKKTKYWPILLWILKTAQRQQERKETAFFTAPCLWCWPPCVEYGRILWSSNCQVILFQVERLKNCVSRHLSAANMVRDFRCYNPAIDKKGTVVLSPSSSYGFYIFDLSHVFL